MPSQLRRRPPMRRSGIARPTIGSRKRRPAALRAPRETSGSSSSPTASRNHDPEALAWGSTSTHRQRRSTSLGPAWRRCPRPSSACRLARDVAGDLDFGHRLEPVARRQLGTGRGATSARLRRRDELDARAVNRSVLSGRAQHRAARRRDLSARCATSSRPRRPREQGQRRRHDGTRRKRTRARAHRGPEERSGSVRSGKLEIA